MGTPLLRAFIIFAVVDLTLVATATVAVILLVKALFEGKIKLS